MEPIDDAVMQSCGGPRFLDTTLAMFEWALQQYERIGSHVGAKQCAMAVVSSTVVKHQPIAHLGERLAGACEKLREQGLCANVALLAWELSPYSVTLARADS
jgi:hypothetical protein